DGDAETDARGGEPLVEAQPGDDGRLRLAAVRLLDEACETGEDEIEADGARGGDAQAPESREHEADDGVADDGIERRRVDGRAAELGDAADARERARVEDAERCTGGRAMAAPLDQASEAAGGLDPGRGGGERRGEPPGVGADERG